MTCAIARIDALVSGDDADRAVLDASKKSAQEAAYILAEVYQEEHGVPIDLTVARRGNDQSRSEGADDVTGRRLQTGTDVTIEISDGLGCSIPNTGGSIDDGVDGDDMGGLGMLADGLNTGSLNSSMDIDLNAYMAEQSMDLGDAGYHFGRSPDWFYDLNGWAASGNYGNVNSGM
jgi:hypothetical protein